MREKSLASWTPKTTTVEELGLYMAGAKREAENS